MAIYWLFDKDGFNVGNSVNELYARDFVRNGGAWTQDETGRVVHGSKPITHRKPVATLDLTPTWTSLLPALLAIYSDGNATGRAVALDELKRMAQAADAYNKIT